MKITVIGHICLDLPQEQTAHQVPFEYGGIFYSLATLAQLSTAEDRIVPVFGVGNAEYDGLVERLKSFPNVDLSGIYKFDGQTNCVRVLSRNGAGERIECSEHIAPPIPFSRVEPFLDTDGVLVNMISGFDVSLETFDRIRMHVRDRGAPIHFDVHSLSLGVDDRGKRFRRPLIDWRRWCFMLSSMQMNEEEAAGLTTERYDETALMNQLRSLMVQSLVITRGNQGATLIRQERKKLTRHEIAPVNLGSEFDPPGCGDVFGAAFFHSLLKTNDVVTAANAASRIAGWKSTFSGSTRLVELHDRLKRGDFA